MKKSSISLYKSGKFYNAFNDDGIILHSLLGYKYVTYKQCVGFPESAFEKVKRCLEQEKISYEVYEKDQKIEEYKGISKNYGLLLKKTYKELEVETRVNNLRQKIEECSTQELERIIEAIECGQFK